MDDGESDVSKNSNARVDKLPLFYILYILNTLKNVIVQENRGIIKIKLLREWIRNCACPKKETQREQIMISEVFVNGWKV